MYPDSEIRMSEISDEILGFRTISSPKSNTFDLKPFSSWHHGCFVFGRSPKEIAEAEGVIKMETIKENWQSKRIRNSQAYQNHSFEIGLNGMNLIDRNGKAVTLENGHKMVEFMSCSYLGLECDPRIARASRHAIDQYGVQFAAARTRLKPILFDQLDDELEKIFQGPTVTYATVGLAHLALFPILGSGELPSYPMSPKGVVWIVDKTSHASIQILRSLMNQFGEVERVSFQNKEAIADAFERAAREGKTPVSVSDGVGSMGGNAPVKFLFELAENHGGYCYLDDAHGTSIIGENGAGYVIEELGGFHPRLILASSLSKAFGATGGTLSFASKKDANFMKRFSTPYIFGGPVSLPGIAAALESTKIHLSSELKFLQKRLRQNLETFDRLAGPNTINAGQIIPIRGLHIGSEVRALSIGKELVRRGFATTTAMYPTVAKGQAMSRVAISALHSTEQIENLIRCFNELNASTRINEVKNESLEA